MSYWDFGLGIMQLMPGMSLPFNILSESRLSTGKLRWSCWLWKQHAQITKGPHNLEHSKYTSNIWSTWSISAVGLRMPTEKGSNCRLAIYSETQLAKVGRPQLVRVIPVELILMWDDLTSSSIRVMSHSRRECNCKKEYTGLSLWRWVRKIAHLFALYVAPHVGNNESYLLNWSEDDSSIML